ncbi:hypothetical protein AXF42_Ash005275 [Apostasia shenzhenica]|uniref:Late embryogenesis abundant protein LEA-2 subgroup domain-containing protein n=1 Tax=Apostasia shenzhenica TaxID=1088818 RepID=A0A2I0B6H4_9ASPA|nr:hypothetical protein AXF42_Ash005275 [Apostasia shenzhenica]
MEKFEHPISAQRPLPRSGSRGGAEEEAGDIHGLIAIEDYSSAAFPRRIRRCLLLCGLCAAVLLFLGVVAIILSFTVFLVHDPTLSMNAVYVHRLGISGDGTPLRPLSSNATMVADISVRNRNAGALRFGESLTKFTLEGKDVGSWMSPGARVPARETVKMNVTGSVAADRVVLPDSAAVLVRAGILRVTSRTAVVGRVDVLGMFKRNVGVSMVCTLSLSAASRTATFAGGRDCVTDLK